MSNREFDTPADPSAIALRIPLLQLQLAPQLHLRFCSFHSDASTVLQTKWFSNLNQQLPPSSLQCTVPEGAVWWEQRRLPWLEFSFVVCDAVRSVGPPERVDYIKVLDHFGRMTCETAAAMYWLCYNAKQDATKMATTASLYCWFRNRKYKSREGHQQHLKTKKHQDGLSKAFTEL
jgi:hypothetical protein